MVDKVLEYEAGKSITALKNVTISEPFFEGHFPELPVMPGVLILEALAQTCGVLSYLSRRESEDGHFFADRRRRLPLSPRGASGRRADFALFAGAAGAGCVSLRRARRS